MTTLLVSIGTDGNTDWVKTPDGQKFSLGPVSVLDFVTKLSRSSGMARVTLDRFLRGEEAMLPVNEDRMWEILSPQKPRWAADSFISADQRLLPLNERQTMGTIQTDLLAAENIIQQLNKLASESKIDAKLVGQLIQATGKIKSPNQSKNQTYYGLSSTVEAAASDDGLESTTYLANMEVAEDILKKAKETVSTIDRLAAEGKKFNSVQAKADVLKVTSRVASICDQTELVESWVGGDLQKLAKRSDELHALFH